MYDYISGFAGQLRSGYSLGQKAEIPKGDFSAVIFCGMGGSAIGGDLLAGYAKDTMKIPFVVNRYSRLPRWVNENTLVIISSYSGNTEETMGCFWEARERGTRILAITSGGQLGQNCAKDKIPVITIPGGLPPRAALGYSFAPLYALFERFGFINAYKKRLLKAADTVERLTAQFCLPDSAPARLAAKLQNKVPVFYAASQGFEAVVTRFKCQSAENAKTLAFGNCYPELSHNEIVGWGNPAGLKRHLGAVFLDNPAKFDPYRKQAKIIKGILKAEKIPVYTVSVSGDNLLERILSFVHFADWLSYHWAVLQGVDPIPIERIDLLKARMKG